MNDSNNIGKKPKPKNFIIIALVFSLVAGLGSGFMMTFVGSAVYPPLVKITEPIVGKITIECVQQSYHRPGECTPYYWINGKNRLFSVMFLTFIMYSAIFFVIFMVFITLMKGVFPKIK